MGTTSGILTEWTTGHALVGRRNYKTEKAEREIVVTVDE